MATSKERMDKMKRFEGRFIIREVEGGVEIEQTINLPNKEYNDLIYSTAPKDLPGAILVYQEMDRLLGKFRNRALKIEHIEHHQSDESEVN